MMIPKFKAEHDEILWDCLFDIKLIKYHECFNKVKSQFYNQMPDGENEVLFQILNQILIQTTEEFKLQKPEYQ